MVRLLFLIISAFDKPCITLVFNCPILLHVTKLIIHNLGLDDLKSDSETDDEDNPKKQVPRWAEGSELRTALLKQCYLGPNIDQIFFTVTDPDLSEMFGQAKSR